MKIEQLKPNALLTGPIFPEPIQVIVTVPMGESVKLVGKGTKSGKVYEPVLNESQLEKLIASPENEPYDGDASNFRIGIEALRLSIAYEYDPYFSLSIARVDPLPHQLEAVYEYFLQLPRIRFLLADDPGAGKTIMAGLLIKELKIRGLIKRTLIVTPANLCFQWQRELKDKFREQFEVVRSDVLRANYGTNPWQDKHQVVTSVSWVSRIEDAKESLLRSHWDLIIVDEAHKMSASRSDKKTLAYQLGESLSQMTDHYLLMTATPHKGDPEHFRLFLELLDKDVYGDIHSIDEAIKNHEAPFYIRRVKEALVTFPNPDTGQSKLLFTKRQVNTSEFQIDNEELEFYDALSTYVDDQSIKASSDDSARGRALSFTMAMLQRRFASSIYAVHKSLERMKNKREKILADPIAYRKSQIERKLPDDFDELEESEQQDIISKLEEVVASIDPAALKEEIFILGRLIDQARILEEREVESKLVKLREVLTEHGVFKDPKMKLLLFTEHKDTLDYLVAKMRSWGLTVTQIHGGMKIGDRDTPNTRIYAEHEFRTDCQVLIATEAAGEGINLQFCWFMINYDIPWNPVRLEQRMGRIHRYGQEKDCLIFNFVTTNTREGRVLHKLFERIESIEKDLDPNHTGKIFNVMGDVFPSNMLERMLRDMYARNLTEDVIKARIVEEVDTDRFRKITNSTLEGLAKRELNLSAIVGKTAEAKERRLVPEVIEGFFLSAASLAGIRPKELSSTTHAYHIGKIPRTLWPIGERLEPWFGKLARSYKNIIFDKNLLNIDPTFEWVTPGHPLFESVRDDVSDQVQDDLIRGVLFYDVQSKDTYRLDIFRAVIKDGRGNTLHERLLAVQIGVEGQLLIRQPTIFLDLIPSNKSDHQIPLWENIPSDDVIESFLVNNALNKVLDETSLQREKETGIISRHMEISLFELINRQQIRQADLICRLESGDPDPLLKANIKTVEDKLFELNGRLERRREELQQERNCTISDIHRVGRAWVLPHPERNSPAVAPMVRDDEIEQIAVNKVIEYEENRGWKVQSVEKENRGFDLISRKPHPEDPETAIEVRFIEVKGRAHVGEISLTANEFKTAERLKSDYWLYVVFDCASAPHIHSINDPVKLGWEPIVKIDHYHVPPTKVLNAEEQQ